MRLLVNGFAALLLLGLGACGESDDSSDALPANVVVRERIAAARPAAILGHRGTGVNRRGHPLAENSIASFVAGMEQGADGIELDVELTADGHLVIMHDDSLDRTTNCTGCVSALDFDAVRLCRLVSGDKVVTGEPPPTLDEVFAALPSTALVNIELKVYGSPCRTATNGPEPLAVNTVEAVRRLGVASRVLLSSFDADAIRAVKRAAPDLYAGYLVVGLRPRDVQTALGAGAEAIHPGGPFPFVTLPPAELAAANNAGLQVNVWTVNDAPSAGTLLEASVRTFITDEPALIRRVLHDGR